MNEASIKRLQELTFEEMLDTVREWVNDIGPEIACERTDTDWSLDPDDEDDRNASYTFRRATIDPLNPGHRDILLEAFLAWAPVPGDPGIPDVEKIYVLKQVDATKRQLATCGRANTNKAAFGKLAEYNRALAKSSKNPLGGMIAATIERRYYNAVKEFRRRLPLERFQRNYSSEQLDELRRLVTPFQSSKPERP
jgi:hypothetical protein